MKMKKTIWGIILLFLVAAAGSMVLFRKNSTCNQVDIVKPVSAGLPNRIGEQILYYVYLGKLYLGTAEFKQLPNAQIDGREVQVMTFETKVRGLNDLETIYSDPLTYLPLKVEREIRMLLSKELITEDYDQQAGKLTITKIKGRKKEETVIEKKGNIHNAILLAYAVRNAPVLQGNLQIQANLPTQEYQIEMTSQQKVTVPAGTYEAYLFSSVPKKFEILMSTDQLRIPICLKGIAGIGYTLKMKSYTPYSSQPSS
jgi:hypothetical protein